MANEAILVQELQERFFEATIADGSAGTDILKGTVMKFTSDPNTVAAATADGDLIAGILIADKKGGDGNTRVALATSGVYALMCTASTGSAVLGEPVKITGANTIAPADDDTINKRAEAFAVALETGVASEVVQVRLTL